MGGKTTPVEEQEWGGIKAINPENGNIAWESKFHLGSLSAGVLATAGSVALAASREGNVMVFESRTEKLLWHFRTGAQIDSSPMSHAGTNTLDTSLCTATRRRWLSGGGLPTNCQSGSVNAPASRKWLRSATRLSTSRRAVTPASLPS